MLSSQQAPESAQAAAEAPSADADASRGRTPVTLPAAGRPAGPDGALAEAVGGSLTWVPYAVYLGGWLALAIASAGLLSPATAEVPPRWLPAYEPLVYAGVALAALGPVLSCAVWLAARRHRAPSERRGLFVAALMRGAVTGFFGLIVWIATLYAIELHALRGAV